MQQPALTTADSRENPFILLVPLNQSDSANQAANGFLYLDDGDSLLPSSDNLKQNYPFSAIQYQASYSSSSSSGMISSSGTFNYNPSVNMNMVIVLGSPSKPNSAKLNGQSLSPQQISYDSVTHAIVFRDLAISMIQPFSLTWN